MKNLIQVDSLRHEKVRYDSPHFPLYLARGDLVSFPQMAAPCHWHEDLELVCVLEGRMRYNVDGERFSLGPGEGIFVNARRLHYGDSPDGEDCDYLCILLQPVLLRLNEHIGRAFLHPLCRNEAFAAAHLSPDIPWQGAVLDHIRSAFQVYQAQRPGFELQLLGDFYHILALLWQNMPQGGGPVSPARQQALGRIRHMVRYMEEHLAEGVTLAAIAAAGGVSESTCNHLFRDYLHRTPIEHLIALRLERSRQLLLESDMQITAIAAALGFSSSSYFASYFRRAFGCTPREYRRRQSQR